MKAHTSHQPVYRAHKARTNQTLATIHAVAAALALTAALGGCDYLPFGYTKVNEIVAAPGPFEGKEVRIKGKAGDTLQLFGLRMFTLADETGQIQVATSGSLPAAGSEVAVKGVVRSAVIVGGKSIGLHMEETQRIR